MIANIPLQVLIGFIGTAYLAWVMLVLLYIVGFSTDTSLHDFGRATNPVDEGLLEWIWKRIGGQPAAKWGPALKKCEC